MLYTLYVWVIFLNLLNFKIKLEIYILDYSNKIIINVPIYFFPIQNEILLGG